ncbi:helix-turn-helix domain-containing protein [Glutamicibacter sp. MNS18]|uniref:IclR family transcriptional regulator n=1 Tax=Glutamicibacter sp. MNS18 TaxID=2989817 RepID=UPI0022364702|nr:helix-turn-helix domain-containing protein [Glutamicibacter sp. MNS18]MCW4465707.1 helix-turn-helix domain-containing protein [Glutamicibacter sp. MNS18]
MVRNTGTVYAMISSVKEEQSAAKSSRTAGSQTLARGLAILRHVTESADGLSSSEVAALAGVHRTVAYRVLNTLCESQLLHRGVDGRYRGAAGLLSLAAAGHQHLRNSAMPHLRQAAGELGATVALLVREGNSAVALAVVSPATGNYHVSFAEGAHHPVTAGAAGIALRAAEPPSDTDTEQVMQARARGFAQTFGEVEPNMFGLAVPLPAHGLAPASCLTVITVRKETAQAALEPLRRTALALLDELSR